MAYALAHSILTMAPKAKSKQTKPVSWLDSIRHNARAQEQRAAWKGNGTCACVNKRGCRTSIIRPGYGQTGTAWPHPTEPDLRLFTPDGSPSQCLVCHPSDLF